MHRRRGSHQQLAQIERQATMRPSAAPEERPALPSVSIVLASYNGGEYIAEQLESIAAQTVLPAQLIVSDDGSADGTTGLVEAFAARAPFPVQLHVYDGPTAFAVNFLRHIDECVAELIAFSDQDDVWRPHKLDVCCRAFADPRVMMCVHESSVVAADLAPLASRRLHTGVVTRWLRGSPMHIPHGSHLLFRSSLLELSPPEERPRSSYGDFQQTHDEWAHFAAVTYGTVKYIEDDLLLFRRHEGAVSGATGEMARRTWLKPYDSETLANRARAAADRARYLRSKAAESSPHRERLSTLAQRYERLSRAEAARSELGGARSQSLRLKAIARAFSRGAYRPQRFGGCGGIAFAQDAGSLIASGATD